MLIFHFADAARESSAFFRVKLLLRDVLGWKYVAGDWDNAA